MGKVINMPPPATPEAQRRLLRELHRRNPSTQIVTADGREVPTAAEMRAKLLEEIHNPKGAA